MSRVYQLFGRLFFVLLAVSLVTIYFFSSGVTSAIDRDAERSMDIDSSLSKATFAGGCFWCMEPPFDKLQGVISTTVGYTGGKKSNPTYKQVASGATEHAEAIEIIYDPNQISYEDLLSVFWRNVDPTTPDRQFCDRGRQYRTAVFYHDDEQQRLAEASKQALENSQRFSQPVVTEIEPASRFYIAEEYHQDYYRKNPLRYKLYRQGCGRDRRLEELWGKAAN